MDKLPLTDEEFKSIYSRVPRLCVDLIIKVPSGIVLTLRTLPTWHGQWHFPGGAVWYEETIVEAANRIAKKELGIDVSIEKTLGYIEFPSEKKERGFGYSVSIPLLCTTEATEFLHNEDSSEVKIFSEIPENMIPEQKAFLEKHNDWR